LTHHPHSGTYLPTGSLLDENPGSTLSGNQQTQIERSSRFVQLVGNFLAEAASSEPIPLS
ncbi:hypothetical protein, partial [Sphingobium wenxiniae]|uniref:hypothetical protein n=1 Tax=Sphingobium wenxiniae (strain DSM 21828 / CGMCC 1.7748 / JZ-1) TaxID=595605 RepID=UPI001C86AD99